MSEKITFQELIESIAEETDHSKQFTRDFLKDFVNVINSGLESDGKVNMAGLGKFKLQRVDEHGGYNPQTEEEITIPAHNKIVFKPYKEVRELVNAPYAHLESELIEKEEEDSADESENRGQTYQQEETVPGGLPDPPDLEEPSERNEADDPFDFVEERNSPSSNFLLEDDAEISETDKDIVEYQKQTAETTGDSSFDEDPDIHREAETGKRDTNPEPEAAYPPSFDKEDNDAEARERNENSGSAEYSYGNRTENEQIQENSSTFAMWAAAAGILLIIVAGGWYFSILPEETAPFMADKQPAAPSQTASNNQQATGDGGEQSQQSSTPAAQQANQQKQSMKSAQTNSKNEEALAVEKGQTLWSIAEAKYGNPRLWPWIYGNNGSLGNPNLIIAGNSLSVPLPSGAQNHLTSSDSAGIAKGYLSTYRWYKNQGSSRAKDHLWGAKVYHENLRNIADVKISKADLSYTSSAR